MPDRMPDWMPEDMSDRVPEDMPDRMAEDLPDRMPEDMPEDMPDHMPEDMPDRMPNRMSEDMSDRMPEDLPVRKCINVMVGITRSKVFFLARLDLQMIFAWKPPFVGGFPFATFDYQKIMMNYHQHHPPCLPGQCAEKSAAPCRKGSRGHTGAMLATLST